MNLKRILVFVLALMVMAMPVGLAESAYGALTMSNFHLEMNGSEPLDIGASLKIGLGGQDDGTGRMDIELTGGEQTAFTGSVGFDKDKVQAIVGGSNYYFEVPMAELEKQMAGATDGATGSLKPEDAQKIKDLVTRYMAILAKYSDPAAKAKLSAQLFPAMNATEAGKESTDLFGQTMELNRFDISMTGEDIGNVYKAMFDADPELKSLMEDYLTLVSDMSGEKMPFTTDNISEYFTSSLAKENVQMKFDLSVWTDTEMTSGEEPSAIKEVVTVTVTAPKATAVPDANLVPDTTEATDAEAAPATETTVAADADATLAPDTTEAADSEATSAPEATPELETVSFPATFSMLKTDEGTRAAFDMQVTPPDETGSLSLAFDGTFDQPGENGGSSSFGTLNMNFADKDTASNVDFKADFEKTISSDNLPHFSFTASGDAAGQKFDMSVGYDGVTATETEQAGTVSFDVNAPTSGVKVAFSCDVKLETSAFAALGDADFAGKTKVSPLSQIPADQKVMEEAGTELYGVMMQAYGVLMQTPGLSNIMGSMMNSGMAG